MAEATPAKISYTASDGGERVVDFHAVISEAHDASGTMTKFPVQTGFEISNHSIRRNRKIIIEAIVTNTPLARVTPSSEEERAFDTKERYSTNMPEARFSELQNLVLNSIPCVVTSNLGEYKPVIFTNFQTKQQQGLTDAIIFTISGEEVQEKSTFTKTGVASQSWEDMDVAETQNLFDEMSKSGLAVDETYKAQRIVGVPARSSFSFPVRTRAGAHTESRTYVPQGESSTSFIYTSENSNTTPVHTIDPSQVAVAFNIFSLADNITDSITRPITNTSRCILEGISAISTRELDNAISTVVGEFQRSARGFLYDTLKVEGDSALNTLAALSIDCFLISAKREAVKSNVPQEITDIIPDRGINRKDGLPVARDYINKARLGGYRETNINLQRETVDIYRVWNPAEYLLGNFGDLNG